MGTVKPALRALAVLWLAPLAGVSCGDTSKVDAVPAAGGTVVVDVAYDFQALEPVTLVDRGPWCSTFAIGGVISYGDCFQADHLPVLVTTDSDRGLLLLAVRSGNKIVFPDKNVRVLATSEYWVAAQMSTDMRIGLLRFMVTAYNHRTRYCRVDSHLVMFCQ